MGKKAKNNKLVKSAGGAKRAVLMPLIKELYTITSTVDKKPDIEEVYRLAQMIEEKQSSFIPPSYNLDRVQAANELIDHLKTEHKCSINAAAESDELGGVRLRLTDDCENNNTVLDIPIDACITTVNREEMTVLDACRTDPILGNMVNVQLALNLLFEVFENKNSKHYHYVRTLPSKPNTIVAQKLEDVLPLKGSSIWMEAEPLLIAVHRQYARLYQMIAQSPVAGFDNLRNGFTLSAYKWAVQIVQTRQNGYPGVNHMELNDLVLIPVLDLCNHAFDSTVRIAQTGDDKFTGLKLSLTPKKEDLKSGSELTLKYSPSCSSEFFLHLGFIPDKIPNDASRLKLSLPKSGSDWRIALLQLLPIQSPFKIGKEHVSHDLVNFIRVFHMSEELAKIKFQDMKTAQSVDLSLGDEESKVFDFLLLRLRLMIANVDRCLEKCPEESLSKKLLQNERTNFTEASDYIRTLIE